MRYYVLEDQGLREYMEDRHKVARLGNTAHIGVVCDGHSGSELSDFCVRRLAYLAQSQLNELAQSHLNVRPLGKEFDPSETAEAMKHVLAQLDSAAKQELPHTSAGTTLCAVLIFPSDIVTANVGDSRAVLYTDGKAVDLSKDHKPSDPSEEDRIMRQGGFVTKPYQTDGVHRVMGRLSLSRALGDWDMRPWVSRDADVTHIPRSQKDEFVVIASDGIWDVLSSEEVGHIVKRGLAVHKAPKEALQLVLQESRRRGSGDNVTLVLLDVAQKPNSRRIL